MNRIASAAIVLLLAAGCAPATRVTQTESVPAPDDAATVTALADRYYEQTLARRPETAYFAGIDLARHDGLTDNGPQALASWQRLEDELFLELSRVDAAGLRGTAAWITHAYLDQALRSSIGRRVCRGELWDVNQMGGWHSSYARIAGLQPVGTPELRRQSLARWSQFAGNVDNEIAHLRRGLELGYSAPKPVVERVIAQVDGLVALATEDSPFYSPAKRDDDPEFAAATASLVEESIRPALTRYRDFLKNEYLPAARGELSVTANPDGLACYEASLRHYTTLDRSGRDVFELGSETVAANMKSVVELGRKAYGIDDFAAIIQGAKADSADRFADRDELLAFSREAVERAGTAMPEWVANMPSQPVEVVPFPEHEEGTGRSAHYRSGTDDRPGEYRIPLHNSEEQSRGNAESTAFHETWPGHHLQVAVGQSVEGLHPITRIVWFSGPGEGWARYSEALAEEMGLYQTTTGPILRRAWPARGMVVDPGIHLFGWTREQAREYMLVSGRFPESQGDALVDRIAILPGQLTAYDSGGLEILALRSEAEAVMGDDFDLREFHDRILENGTIPLGALREHVEAWIADYQRRQSR